MAGRLQFSVSASSWQDGSQKAELPELPPLLRRRASQADRLALRAAFDVVPEGLKLASVFSSRHGELARSVELLEGMARGEGHLPMSFSLSVHNTAAGLWSIARQDPSNSVTLAAGEASLSQGLGEAASLLADGETAVLFVAFDERMPDALAPFREASEEAFALALLLEPGTAFSLEALAPGETRPLPRWQAARELLDFLKGPAEGLSLDRWRLQRHA